ncbi:SpvB/TcaC N-terminal domain-containing protein, partial [Acinetobacter baumannii]|uniref:SpvB/TcaC N-terminal domain-containing protein n=1 Tax=Acinetobacter baumannii TaxID=470 RepID=UPI0037D0DD2C
PYSNVKINFNSSAGTWSVITEDGTKLLFGGSANYEEVTNTYQSGANTDPFVSSWYLQSITSSTGEVINFTYYMSNSVTLDSYFSESDYI